MTNANASPEIQELLILVSLQVFYLIFKAFTVFEFLSVKSEKLKNQLILGESPCLVAKQVVYKSKVLNELQLFDLAPFNLAVFDASFFANHLGVKDNISSINHFSNHPDHSQVERDQPVQKKIINHDCL